MTTKRITKEQVEKDNKEDRCSLCGRSRMPWQSREDNRCSLYNNSKYPCNGMFTKWCSMVNEKGEVTHYWKLIEPKPFKAPVGAILFVPWEPIFTKENKKLVNGMSDEG